VRKKRGGLVGLGGGMVKLRERGVTFGLPTKRG